MNAFILSERGVSIPWPITQAGAKVVKGLITDRVCLISAMLRRGVIWGLEKILVGVNDFS